MSDEGRNSNEGEVCGGEEDPEGDRGPLDRGRDIVETEVR